MGIVEVPNRNCAICRKPNAGFTQRQPVLDLSETIPCFHLDCLRKHHKVGNKEKPPKNFEYTYEEVDEENLIPVDQLYYEVADVRELINARRQGGSQAMVLDPVDGSEFETDNYIDNDQNENNTGNENAEDQNDNNGGNENAEEIEPEIVESKKRSCEQADNSSSKKQKTDETELHKACKENNVEKVMTLLQDRDIKINAQDKDGKTGLHYASEKNYLKIVKLLLDHPLIKVDIQDNSERTAYDLAKKKSIVEQMLDPGSESDSDYEYDPDEEAVFKGEDFNYYSQKFYDYHARKYCEDGNTLYLDLCLENKTLQDEDIFSYEVLPLHEYSEGILDIIVKHFWGRRYDIFESAIRNKDIKTANYITTKFPDLKKEFHKNSEFDSVRDDLQIPDGEDILQWIKENKNKK